MTTNSNDARDALRRLADALAEDVLNAPDSEILEDAAEIYGDPEKLAADMLKLFEQTASEQGKERLAAARAAVAADRRRPAPVVRLPPGGGAPPFAAADRGRSGNRAQTYRRGAER